MIHLIHGKASFSYFTGLFSEKMVSEIFNVHGDLLVYRKLISIYDIRLVMIKTDGTGRKEYILK